MDPNQINHMAGAFAGMMGIIVILGLLFYAFLIFLFWRTFLKAGLSGPLSLLVLIPGIGWLIVLCILAFANWNVIPTSQLYPGLQPYPPPPPNYYPPPPPPPQPAP